MQRSGNYLFFRWTYIDVLINVWFLSWIQSILATHCNVSKLVFDPAGKLSWIQFFMTETVWVLESAFYNQSLIYSRLTVLTLARHYVVLLPLLVTLNRFLICSGVFIFDLNKQMLARWLCSSFNWDMVIFSKSTQAIISEMFLQRDFLKFREEIWRNLLRKSLMENFSLWAQAILSFTAGKLLLLGKTALRISSKSARNYGYGHIYWRNS